MSRGAFSATIAILLLGLYVYAVLVSAAVAQCEATHKPKLPIGVVCENYPVARMTDGLKTILSLVGGLLAALVVATLAVTPPGSSAVIMLLGEDPSPKQKRVLTIVTTAFLLAWLVCGLVALVIGYIKYPDVVPELTAQGKTWLGTAVAAGYAYFGLNIPKKLNQES